MSDPPPRFALSQNDRAQGLWMRLRAHFEERLAVARQRNDNELLSDHETAAIRGEIRCLKRLIALDSDRPFVPGHGEQP